jgi:hypothetical protein
MPHGALHSSLDREPAVWTLIRWRHYAGRRRSRDDYHRSTVPRHGALLAAVLLALLLAARTAATSSLAPEPPPSQTSTPMLLSLPTPPVPFTGSDAKTHLVYELWLANFSSVEARVKQVLVSSNGTVLQSLDAASVAGRLQPAGARTSSGAMPPGTQSLLFINLTIPG